MSSSLQHNMPHQITPELVCCFYSSVGSTIPVIVPGGLVEWGMRASGWGVFTQVAQVRNTCLQRVLYSRNFSICRHISGTMLQPYTCHHIDNIQLFTGIHIPNRNKRHWQSYAQTWNTESMP